MNISRGAADTDDRNLCLFKQWAKLSGQDKLRLTAALCAAPWYEMVDFDENDGEDFGIEVPRPQRLELPALMRGPSNSVSQANFMRLDGKAWLDDTIIDMFLHTYVNEQCEGVRCTRTHFMTKLLEGIEGDSDLDAVESAEDNYSEVQD